MELNYMDMEEFMDTYEYNQSKESLSSLSFLQSVGSLGEMISQTDPDANGTNKSTPQDLTADLFCNMSDSEIMSHFIPVRGIDYGLNFEGVDLLKKDKKVEQIEESYDELLPHLMIQQSNPIYKIGGDFNSVFPTNKESLLNTDSPPERTANVDATKKVTVSNNYMGSQKDGKSNTGYQDKVVPRPVKKRKPRTYKYNPKPLQHKESRAFVPEDLKDIDYWERRKRNNEAAKKSREERRKKELEILNNYDAMKEEYSQIKIENVRLRARNAVLEQQIDELKSKN
ncbi:transcription factor VBP-like [Hydractinia symbiolongicarpus]|uniref:transcription factor VBP-like n=1 Tax=Hydractinia symbiolongicarpus TaxID=13093 RepID=UPI002551A3BA|nr:transcription factor VBP-like [Hydractinia symbiolongicarpus]